MQFQGALCSHCCVPRDEFFLTFCDEGRIHPLVFVTLRRMDFECSLCSVRSHIGSNRFRSNALGRL